jgi:hypothetical protein
MDIIKTEFLTSEEGGINNLKPVYIFVHFSLLEQWFKKIFPNISFYDLSGTGILNGRISGDFMGEFTCFTPNGSSVVDYFISSESLIKNVLFFKVNKFLGELSDHCQISIMLRTGHQIYNTSDSRSHLSPSTYKWDDNSTQLFQNAMSSTRIDELIINFNENNYNNIDSMVNDNTATIRCEASKFTHEIA